jgi:hypothetical protein
MFSNIFGTCALQKYLPYNKPLSLDSIAIIYTRDAWIQPKYLELVNTEQIFAS